MSGLPFIALVATLALVSTACGEDSAGPETGASVDDVRDDGIDEEDFLADPEPYLGDKVTVSAEVADVIGPAAFTIAGEGGPPPVLVVSAPNSIPKISDNTVVKVTGTVRDFGITTVESDLGIDLDDPLVLGYEDDHVIVADSVSVLKAEEDGKSG